MCMSSKHPTSATYQNTHNVSVYVCVCIYTYVCVCVKRLEDESVVGVYSMKWHIILCILYNYTMRMVYPCI